MTSSHNHSFLYGRITHASSYSCSFTPPLATPSPPPVYTVSTAKGTLPASCSHVPIPGEDRAGGESTLRHQGLLLSHHFSPSFPLLLEVNNLSFSPLPTRSPPPVFLSVSGVQHLAFMSSDLVKTVQEMKARSDIGGFSFLPRPSPKYYREAAARVGDAVTAEELREYQEQGILLDVDDRGVILQIFTAPVGDRYAVR